MLADLFNNIPIMIIAVGALVGVAASLLGTFLVLRKSSMLSDAISHSIVFGIVIVWLLTRQQSGPVQILGAALTGVLTVFLTELLVNTRKVKNDAAIGLVFPVLFSIGVLLLNLYARDVHIDQHAVLLGEIAFVWLDTVQLGPYSVPQALLWMGVMTLINLLFVTLLYKELKLATFDAALAKALGFAPVVLFYALLALVSGTAVAAFDAVGAVLFIAFVIVPPSAAYLLTDRLWKMMLYGSLISVTSSVFGYILAMAWDVSIGGMMATLTGVFLLLAFVFGPRYGLITQELRRVGQRRDNADRMLLVHLYNHEEDANEGNTEASEENLIAALRSHLRWSPKQIRETVERVQARKLVDRGPREERLYLTSRGRALAREVLEPWRMRATEETSTAASG